MLDKILKKEIIAPVLIVIVSFLLYKLAKFFIKKTFKIKNNKLQSKKTQTIMMLFINIIKVFFIVVDLVTILDVYGIDVKSILASLGVFAAVAALAMQDILKDFISGIAIVLEGQFNIGDTVSIGDFKGEVIYLSLKTTKIKSYTGEVKIIANHNVENVINYSVNDSLAIVDICVSYEEDLNKVEKVLNETCLILDEKIDHLKGKFTILGVQELGDSSIKYRLTCLTEPCNQYVVQRKALKIIKEELDKNKIEIPFPQLVVHNG